MLSSAIETAITILPAAIATVFIVFMVTRLTVTSNKIVVRSIKNGVYYVAGSKQRRVQAAVNAKVLKQFNSTRVCGSRTSR